MRIPDNILDGVCFLGVKIGGGPHVGLFQTLGTAFLVTIVEGPLWFSYLVTARHVVDEAKRGGYPNLIARVNGKDGNAIMVELPDGWVMWENPAIDVAVIAFPMDYDRFAFAAMPLDMLVDAPVMQRNSIGPGDELFAVGLFSLRVGTQRNIPIVRSGILAAMPYDSEPFTKDGYPYHAYLAEMRSIGGLSGSPVFIFIDKHRLGAAPDIPEGKDFIIFCLGLIRGHWDLQRETGDSAVAGQADDVRLGFSKGENLNTGIAVVTPSQYVLGLLTHPDLDKARKDFVETKNKESEPT